ncbi:hypothetical protein J4734_24050 [Klebsiella pneumoniae]|uniref:Uncharacterized protein n=1 Tax=Klebsiella pneumoniae TaxID=573 RepID=A0A939NPG5_KLEPN|nr:hypothetical protein [Klebsiella pneumoniae]
MSKMRTLPEMRAAAASMNAILNELPLHVGYCAQWGLANRRWPPNLKPPKPQLYPLCAGYWPLRVTRWICWSP